MVLLCTSSSIMAFLDNDGLFVQKKKKKHYMPNHKCFSMGFV